jgi:hypothetical protein
MISSKKYIQKTVPAMFSRMPETMNCMYKNQGCQHRAGEPHSLKLHLLQNLSSYLPLRHHTIIVSQLISGTDWLGSVDDFPFTSSHHLHLQFTQATRTAASH